MKRFLILFFLSLQIGLSAQNFILNGKISKPFNKNFTKAYTFELLIATNDSAYSIGVLGGFAFLDFNYLGYDWAASYEEAFTKSMRGIISYIYPLNRVQNNFLRHIYFSFLWGQISNHGLLPGGGYMFAGTGYAYPGSRNENLMTLSCGYRIPLETVNILFSIGYQHREYDLTFSEYSGDSISSLYRSIHQIEESIQIDFAIQYVF